MSKKKSNTKFKTNKKTKEKNLGGRPPKFKSEEELSRLIDEYFESLKTPVQDEEGNITGERYFRPPTVTGLAVYLDTTRTTLIDYENGNYDSDKNKFSHTIKKGKARVEQYVEEELFRYKGSATGVIFNLKNNFGWKDSQELHHKGDMEVNINVEGE